MSDSPSLSRPRRASLWARLWRRPWFKRLFYEGLGLLLLLRRGMQVLNCGFHEPGYPAFPLPPDDEPERLGLQLYHKLVAGADLAGRDVLETGCGRGGGARVLTGLYRPASYTATDSSRMFMWACRWRNRLPNLRFIATVACPLPFPDASFDYLLTVEAVNLLPDKAGYLAEASRVLRPGGRLLVTDYFYTRETSGNAVGKFRAAIAASGLRLVAEENWTARAVAALETDSPRRRAEIARLPAFLRGPAISFAGTTASPLYQQLCDGRAVHLHFDLAKA